MGVIYPQAVKMRITNTNVRYYVNKGYNIPQRKTIDKTRSKAKGEMVYCTNIFIDVLIDDLPEHSNAIIWYYCDCCGKLNHVHRIDYGIRHKTFNEPVYCRHCSVSTLQQGPLHYHWDPSKTEEERLLGRSFPEYREFVKRVMARDNYTCQCCGEKISQNGVVHHIDGYNWDKEHRLSDENGITLCKNCHRHFHSNYGKGNNTRAQFEEWLGKRIQLKQYFGGAYNLPKIYCIEDKTIFTDKYELAKLLNVKPKSVWRVCTGRSYTLKGKHYVYYENFLNMTEQEIKELLNKDRYYRAQDMKVLCITTGNLYINATNAINSTPLKSIGCIITVCNGKKKYYGKLNDVSLRWMWYRDFIQLPLSEQLKIAEQNKETLVEGSFLYTLLTENNRII